MNIYDTANQLERELRQHEAFLALKEAQDKVKQDPEAKELFDQFSQANMELQTKHMSGQELSDEDIEKINQLSEKVKANPLISSFMQTEQQVHLLLQDLNRIITKPLEELYRM